MNRIYRYVPVFFLIALANWSCSPKKGEAIVPRQQPNIIFILMDDLGWPSLSSYGNEKVNTTHIDRLSREGMRFTQAYVTPQCTPTRASFITGQHTARNRMWHVIPGYGYPMARLKEPEYIRDLPRESFTVAEALQKAGYYTAMLGKWHLSTYENDGYYTRLFRKAKHYYGFDYVDPPTEPSEYQAIGDKGVRFLTDQAIKIVEQQKDSANPFFIFLSHHTIHGPILAPDSLVQKYLKRGYPEEGLHHAAYLAAIEHFDHEIGRLLDKLDELNLSDETAVFFTSDNGGVDRYFDNAPLRHGKGSAYEGGIRVPFLVRWPGEVQPETINSTPIHVTDFYPTLVDMAGGQLPENHPIDGSSLVPLFQGEQNGLADRSLYWYMPLYDPQWGAVPAAVIRKGPYKLIRFFGDYIELENNSLYIPEGRLELYQLEEDISEQHDLSKTQPAIADSLEQELMQWLRKMDAPLPTLNENYKPDSVFFRPKR